MSEVGTKRCTKCGEEKPATPEFFHYRSKARASSLAACCKACKNESNRSYQEANPEKVREQKKQYYEANKEAILEAHKRYNQANPEKVREQKKQYYEADKEAILEAQRSYYEASRDQQRKRARKYRIEHREQVKRRQDEWCKSNPEKVRAKARRYWLRHPEADRIKRQRRRARKHNLPNNFTFIDWQRAIDYFRGCCAVCGRPLNDLFGDHKAAADHWIPLSSPDCPGTVPTNIVPLCHGKGGCNNSKYNSQPLKWLVRRYGESKAAKVLTRIEAYFKWVKQQEQ